MAIRTTAMADGALNLVVTDMGDTKCSLPFSDNITVIQEAMEHGLLQSHSG